MHFTSLHFTCNLQSLYHIIFKRSLLINEKDMILLITGSFCSTVAYLGQIITFSSLSPLSNPSFSSLQIPLDKNNYLNVIPLY